MKSLMMSEDPMFHADEEEEEGEESEKTEKETEHVIDLSKKILMQPIVDPSIFLELIQITPEMDELKLPHLVTGIRYRNQNVKYMTCDTLAGLIQGEFVEQLGPATVYEIFDCRFPHQYIDGHIMGARNLSSRKEILKTFPMEEETSMEPHQMELRRRPCIYVFYCDYSLERAPKFLNFLRYKDQRRDYPELYLLHGGYNNFCNLHRQLCGM